MLKILNAICSYTSKEELKRCLVELHRNSLKSTSCFSYAVNMISKSKPEVARILTSSLKMDFDIFPKMEKFVRNQLNGNLGKLLTTRTLTENSIVLQPQELPDVKSYYYNKFRIYELALKHYCSDDVRPLVKLLFRFIKLSVNCQKPSDFAKCEQHFEKYAAAFVKEVEKPNRQRRKFVTVRPFELGMGVLKKVFTKKEDIKHSKQSRKRKYGSEDKTEAKKTKRDCDGTEGYKHTFRKRKTDKRSLQEPSGPSGPSGKEKQRVDLQEGNADQQLRVNRDERSNENEHSYEDEASNPTNDEGKGKTNADCQRQECRCESEHCDEVKVNNQPENEGKRNKADRHQHDDGAKTSNHAENEEKKDKDDAELQRQECRGESEHCDEVKVNNQPENEGKRNKADRQQHDDGAKTSNQPEYEEQKDKKNAELQKHGNGCGERLEKNHRKEVIEESINNRQLYLMYLKCMLEYIFELPHSRFFLYHAVPPLQMNLECLREKCEQVPTHLLTAIYNGLNSIKCLSGRVAWQFDGRVTYQGNPIFNVIEICKKKHQCNTNNSDAVPSNLTELFRAFTNKRCPACATLPELEKLITLLDEEVMGTKLKRNNSTPDYEQNDEVEEEL